jgi:hypothetical protein
MLVTQDEFGGRFDFVGRVAVHSCYGIRPRPRVVVVSVFEAADTLRFTAEQSFVDSPRYLAVSGREVVFD